MKAFFENLFQYTDHFNTVLIQKMMVEQAVDLSKSHRLMSHMLNAHHIWNKRILGQSPEVGVWQSMLLTEMLDRNEDNYQQTQRILHEADLDTTISYTNSKGDSFQNTVQDILFQVVNHTSYHRAQIATDFREHGLEPIMTDYIMYKR
ncbi:DinB family protein [Telluribacter sp. SYSU D00476]|uniref:DinB family protein n=1 Tax=Telluribacter sp. SYSU D00476 TaxID=2811430 RepID=UPI001FF66204|nr:DinB family protein [Telluribacter sp. SYSU D00476]